jgi:hypothetical protein
MIKSLRQFLWIRRYSEKINLRLINQVKNRFYPAAAENQTGLCLWLGRRPQVCFGIGQ